MTNNGTGSQREKRKCRNKLCVCREDTEDSSESNERKCKKSLNYIPPEYFSRPCSSQNKENRSRATSKVNNEKPRKPLQERLKRKCPVRKKPCNIICLCNRVVKPEYSETTIRKVPPEPCNCCGQERELEIQIDIESDDDDSECTCQIVRDIGCCSRDTQTPRR